MSWLDRAGARRAWVGLLAAWLVGGAAVEHLGGERRKVLPGWFMYTSHGARLCEVHWVQRTSQGDVALDRREVLGRPPWWAQASSTRNLLGRAEVMAEARRLCEARPGADLRADVRCGSEGGWRAAMAREVPLCRR